MNKIAATLLIVCISFVSIAQQNSGQVNSRVQKLEDVIDKNEYNARLALRNAKIAYQDLMISQKAGTISGDEFERKKELIIDAMNKGKEALTVIYEAKGLLPE